MILIFGLAFVGVGSLTVHPAWWPAACLADNPWNLFSCGTMYRDVPCKHMHFLRTSDKCSMISQWKYHELPMKSRWRSNSNPMGSLVKIIEPPWETDLKSNGSLMENQCKSNGNADITPMKILFGVCWLSFAWYWAGPWRRLFFLWSIAHDCAERHVFK